MNKLPLTLFAGTLIAPLGYAQETPPAEAEEVFELSPFVVEAGSEMGYLATATLAGTRLKAQLKDIGAAVSVYTPEFLEDTGATDIEEILTFTAGTEGAGMQGNFAGFVGESSDEVRGNPGGVNRVRALSNATRTRDYFASDMPSDSYNFSNLTINRGPNAILAGIGAAGGIIDVTLKRAIWKNTFDARVRLGSYNSHREEIHVNNVLIDDRFAVRVDMLNEHSQFRQDPTYEKDQRIYLAGTVKLRKGSKDAFWGRTNLHANFEVGEIEGTPPNMLTPVMSIQSWFDGIDPRDGEPWAEPKWRTNGAARRIYGPDGVTVANPDIIAGFPLYRQWNLVFADPTSGEAGVGITDPAYSNIQGYMGTVPRNAKNVWPGGYLRATGDQNRNRTGYYRTRLTDPKVFNFYDELMTGAFDRREQDFKALDFRVEQLLMGGKAGFEVAFNKQQFERSRDIPISGDNELLIDTTEFLSVRTDAYNDNPGLGTPTADQLIENPNFGRAMVITRDAFRDQINTSDRDSAQINAFIQHNFSNNENLLGRLLGRHTLSGLYFETDIETRNKTFRSTWQPDGELDLKASTGNIPGTFPAQVNAFFYISDSLLDVASADDIRLSAISTKRPEFGETYTLRVFDTVLKEFVTGTSTPRRVLGNYGGVDQTVTSKALSLQSHWLADHVVTLVSWRRDESEALSYSVIPPAGETERLPDGNLNLDYLVAGDVFAQAEDSWTKSVVVNFPEEQLFELPFNTDLRFYWNQSENFNPVGLRRNQWNEELGSPAASTEEFGIGFSMFKGKLDVRINQFETKISDAAISGVPNAYGYTSTLITRMLAANSLDLVPAEWGYTYSGFTTFEDVARAFYDTIPDRLAANIGPEFNFNPRFAGTGIDTSWEPDNIVSKSSVSDVISEGTEIEVVWNPTRSWRFALNVSKNEAVKANVAAAELEYATIWRNNLETMFEGNLLLGERNPGQAEGNTFWPQYIAQTLADIQTQNALSGTVSPEIRKWRANLLGRYEFRRGPLKGLTLGATVRWQDEIAIGYPYITDENGNTVADINNPYFGPEDTRIGINGSYRRKLDAFGQNMDWIISFNVQNLTADDDLIPIAANADGSYGTLRIPPQRTWTVTNTFRF